MMGLRIQTINWTTELAFAPTQATTPITRILGDARRRLLETGNRNRLIHVNRANARANCLSVINEPSDDIYAILRTATNRMRFKSMGKPAMPKNKKHFSRCRMKAWQMGRMAKRR